MNKESIMNSPTSNANEGRLSDAPAQVPNTTMPKSTNSEKHGSKQDVASTEGNNINPSMHGKQGSNSHKA